MNWAVFTLVIGVLFVCAEIFVPGGILGIIGAVSLLISLVLAYLDLGFVQGTYFLIMEFIIVLIGILISLKFFPKSKIGKLLTLSSSEKGFASSNEEKYQNMLETEGTAFTDLRPAGTAVISGRKIDVTTEGGFIEKDSKIKVIKIEGSKVIVRKI